MTSRGGQKHEIKKCTKQIVVAVVLALTHRHGLVRAPRQAPENALCVEDCPTKRKHTHIVGTGHATISRQISSRGTNTTHDITRVGGGHDDDGNTTRLTLAVGDIYVVYLAVLLTKPTSMSDCLITYVPVQANEAPISQRPGMPLLPQSNPWPSGAPDKKQTRMILMRVMSVTA